MQTFFIWFLRRYCVLFSQKQCVFSKYRLVSALKPVHFESTFQTIGSRTLFYSELKFNHILFANQSKTKVELFVPHPPRSQNSNCNQSRTLFTLSPSQIDHFHKTMQKLCQSKNALKKFFNCYCFLNFVWFSQTFFVSISFANSILGHGFAPPQTFLHFVCFSRFAKRIQFQKYGNSAKKVVWGGYKSIC